ncbi:hypothetical protein ACJJI4_07465 [Microbulbifer sp. TRSA002]|uniref:hypothetical protein n=1 Tax=unclassified Microbulbifer TaxID=2619833 RepID=UPI0040391B18
MKSFTIQNKSGKISFGRIRGDHFSIKIRTPAEGVSYDSLVIKIPVDCISRFKRFLDSRMIDRLKLGQSKGIFKEYLLIERESKFSPVKIELNSWMLVFGANLSIRLERSDVEQLSSFLSEHA